MDQGPNSTVDDQKNWNDDVATVTAIVGGTSVKSFPLGVALLCMVLSFANPSFPQANGSKAEVPRAGVNGVTAPTCISCPNPHYTKKGRKAKFEGRVVLDVIVSTEGRAEDVKLIRGTEKDLGLEQSAIDTVRKWRFKPSNGPDGKPIAALVTIEVTFRMH